MKQLLVARDRLEKAGVGITDRAASAMTANDCSPCSGHESDDRNDSNSENNVFERLGRRDVRTRITMHQSDLNQAADEIAESVANGEPITEEQLTNLILATDELQALADKIGRIKFSDWGGK